MDYTTSSFELDNATSTFDPCLSLDTNLTTNDSRCHDYDNYHEAIDQFTLIFYHVLWTIVCPTLFALIIITGTFGNLLVIYVILSRPKMQTTTNYLLLNLAASDLAFLLICVPITAYRYAAFTWTFGDITCKVVNYVIYVTAYVTVYTLVVISLLRYATVIHGISTARFRTKKNIVILNVLIWIVVLIVNIASLLTHQLKTFDEHFAYCGLVAGATKPFFISFFVTGYLLPLAVITVLYVIVIQNLHQKSASALGQTRQRTIRASKVIIVVVMVFALLWLPLHVNQLLSAFQGVPQGKVYEVFRILANSLAYGNSCANPIIYNFVSKEFKIGFRDVVCCRKISDLRHRNGTTDVAGGTERTSML